MASRNGSSIQPVEKGSLDARERARLSAEARIGLKHKDEGHQRTVPMTTAVQKTQPVSATHTITNTVSKLANGPETRAVGYSTNGYRQPDFRKTAQLSGGRLETVTLDMSQDDETEFSFVEDSYLHTKGPNTMDESMMHDSMRALREIHRQNDGTTYGEAQDGYKDLEEDYSDADEGESDEEHEDEEENPVTQLLKPTLEQQLLHKGKQTPTAHQQTHSQAIPGTVPVKPTMQTTQPFSNPNIHFDIKPFTHSKPKPTNQVHFHDISPNRAVPHTIPIREQSPARGATPAPKRSRLTLDSKTQKQSVAGAQHSASNKHTAKSATQQQGLPHSPPPSQNNSNPVDADTLDYPPEILAKKKYSDLQKEAFDQDPNRQPDRLHELFGPEFDYEKASLTERIAKMRSVSDAKAQVTFFQGLGLNEWEEAGDWFLSQFSEFMTRAKDLRKEKRNVAARFETEVHKRNGDVEERMQKTEVTMGEMKERGQRVVSQAWAPSEPNGH
jgi:hypothetical protein